MAVKNNLGYKGDAISCKFGKFQPGWEGNVSGVVKEALLGIPGFYEINSKKAKKREGIK